MLVKKANHTLSVTKPNKKREKGQKTHRKQTGNGEKACKKIEEKNRIKKYFFLLIFLPFKNSKFHLVNSQEFRIFRLVFTPIKLTIGTTPSRLNLVNLFSNRSHRFVKNRAKSFRWHFGKVFSAWWWRNGLTVTLKYIK